MDEGDESLEQILSKNISKSQLGVAELSKFQNVTELTNVTIRFSKKNLTNLGHWLQISKHSISTYKKKEKGIQQV